MEHAYVTAGVGTQNTSPRRVGLSRAGGEVGFTLSGVWEGRGCDFPHGQEKTPRL